MSEPTVVGGRYQILRVLGRGGMGEVFLAHDSVLDMDVAIKRVPPALATDPLLKNALIKEARILARLNDPHIVRLFDLADTADGLLLVLEYVCGPSLQQVLAARGRLTETELLHVMRHMAAGLTTAHGQGVIHRDLKPPNLLLQLPPTDRAAFLAHGTMPPDILDMHVKVADFGIAKLLEGSGSSTAFATAGSPAYMAPEQYLGQTPSAETDVYAMGIIAYEVLAGHPPFTQGDLAHQHLSVPPPRIAGCTPRIDAAVHRALDKNRDRRYPTAAAFVDALSGARAESEQPQIPEERRDDDEPPRPWIGAAVVWGLIVASLIAVAAGTWMKLHPNPAPFDHGDRSKPPEQQSALPSLGPAPYVTELPPVVEESRNPLVADAGHITGPRKPKVLWSARVLVPDATMLRVVGAGPEGNTYLLAYTLRGAVLCALKDRKLVWGYDHVPGGHFPSRGEFDLAPDGRLWMLDISGSSINAQLCFNSQGQGGHLPAAAKPFVRPWNQFDNSLSFRADKMVIGAGFMCLPDPHGFSSDARPSLMGRASNSGNAWTLPLDQPCGDHASPTVGPTGDAYFQTIDKTLYRVSANGEQKFSFAAACTPEHLHPLPSGDVVFICGADLYRVGDGKLRWKYTWGHDYNLSLLIDQAETVYAVEQFNSGSAMRTDTHVVAVGADGQPLWDLVFDKFHTESLFLDASRRLYVTGLAGDYQSKWAVFCLSD